MTDETTNLVLEHLRNICGAIEGLREDVRELKGRMTAVESQLGQFVASEQIHYAAVQGRFDRMEGRLDRIERRLELAPA